MKGMLLSHMVRAVHTIATVDGVTGAKVNQPYLGNVSPDMDENTTQDWFGDDKATTADEGINQLLPDELKGTTNEMIKMDRTKPGNYKMSIQAHTDGASEAHIYGWVDFNQMVNSMRMNAQISLQSHKMALLS